MFLHLLSAGMTGVHEAGATIQGTSYSVTSTPLHLSYKLSPTPSLQVTSSLSFLFWGSLRPVHVGSSSPVLVLHVHQGLKSQSMDQCIIIGLALLLPNKVARHPWWCTPLILALRKQRQADPCEFKEFQESQGYTEKPCLPCVYI